MKRDYHRIFCVFIMTVSVVATSLIPMKTSNAESHKSSRAESYFNFIRGTLESLNGNSTEALRFYGQSEQMSSGSHYIKLKRAEEYLNLSETASANKLLNEIAPHFQKEADYFVLKARAESQMGHHDFGLKDLDRAIQLYFARDNIIKAREITLTKVALQADQQDYKGAVKTLERFIAKTPFDEIVHYFLGKIHSMFNQKNLAVKSYKTALELRPGFAVAAKALGLIYELSGKNDEAFAVYQNAFRSGAVDDDLVQKLINLSLIQDDLRSALSYIRQSLQWKPDDLQNNLRAGLIHFKLGDFSDAEFYFRTAQSLEGAPLDRVHFYLGSTLYSLNRQDDAIRSLKEIKSDSEYYVEARIQISNIHEKELKQQHLSIKNIDQAIAEKPDLELILAKANLFEGRGDIKKAIQVLSSRQNDFPNSERLLLTLGSLQERIGQIDESIQTMRKILTFDENNTQALNHIGYSYAERGIYLEEAEALLKKAVQLAPNNAYILDSLGWLYYKKGRYSKAHELLRRANELVPNNAVLLEHLADTLHKLNRIPEALATYRRIVTPQASAESTSEDQETRLVKERVREKMSLLVDASPRD